MQRNLVAPDRIKLALLWPLNVRADPVMVAGTAGAVYLITGELPWQVGWQEGLRGYGIGALVYYTTLIALKDEAEIQWIAQHMPAWLKSALGL